MSSLAAEYKVGQTDMVAPRMKTTSPFTPEERAEIIESAIRNTGLTREQAEKLFQSIGERRSKRNPILEYQWVTTLAAVCNALRDGSASPKGLFATVFWIRLYGVITELLSAHEEIAAIYYDLAAADHSHSHLAAIAEVFEACVSVRDSLSDDELVYAAFVRHVHGHVYQDGFEYDIERGNPAQNQRPTLRTKQKVRTVRRHIHVDEVHHIVDRVSAKYSHADIRIAVNFAHIVGPSVERLSLAMEALERHREIDRAATAKKGALEAGQPGVAADGAPPRR